MPAHTAANARRCDGRPPQRQPHARKRASNENYFERRGSMSLYGVMRTGGSGMNAQSNKLSTVADNIANVNTTGYKRASTEFSSLVLQSGTGNYNSGSVETHVRYAISDPGNAQFHHIGDRSGDPGKWLLRRDRYRRHAIPDPRRLLCAGWPGQPGQCGRLLFDGL